MYEARQNKRKDSRIFLHFSTGSLLQLVDNRKLNLNRLCMQMARHVIATCSIDTKEKGSQSATCRSQAQSDPSHSSIIREMNKGVSKVGNELYQCAEPKSLYAVLGPRNQQDTELNGTNLVRSELESIRWKNVKWYDDSKPNELLENAKPCGTCSQWIVSAGSETYKPSETAINNVNLTYKTEEERKQAKEKEKNEKDEQIKTENYIFKGVNSSYIDSLINNINIKVNDTAITVCRNRNPKKNKKSIGISYPIKMQKTWDDIKKEIQDIKNKQPH